MTAIFLPSKWPSLMQPAQFGRNGQIANVLLESRLRTDTNLIMAYRGKEFFHSPGYIIPPAGAAGSRDRWYWYGHTSPKCDRLRVRVVMARDDNGAGHGVTDPYARFSLYDSAGVPIGSSLEFHHGASGSSASNVPDEWGAYTSTIDVSPDIDVYGRFEEVDYARIISSLVYEEALAPDTSNGYFAGLTAGQNIYDNQRADLASALQTQWKRGGATAIKFAPEIATVPRATVSNVPRNIVDDTSLVVSANTPGTYLDFTGRNRRTETTVPCILQVYGRYTAGAAGKHGSVFVKDSAGVTVGSIVDGWNAGAYAWVGIAINMPLTPQKFDVWYSTSSGTFDVLAVDVYEYA